MKPWAFVATMLGLIAAGGWIAMLGEGNERWVGGGAAALVAAGLAVGLRELLGPRPARTAPLTAPPAAPEPLPTRPASSSAPDPLPAQQRSDRWFVAEIAVDAPLTAAQADFLAALRDGARSLPAGGVCSDAFRHGGDGSLIAGITLCDEASQVDLLEVCVQLAGGRLHGDAMLAGLGVPPREPTSLALPPIAGDIPVELVIAWFEQIVRRPVNRVEWWHGPRPYAMRYEFADTTEGMRQAFEQRSAPRGLHERLVRSGGTSAGGWVRTAALGEPDAIVAVRADGRQLDTPRPPELLWYPCQLERRRPA